MSPFEALALDIAEGICSEDGNPGPNADGQNYPTGPSSGPSETGSGGNGGSSTPGTAPVSGGPVVPGVPGTPGTPGTPQVQGSNPTTGGGPRPKKRKRRVRVIPWRHRNMWDGVRPLHPGKADVPGVPRLPEDVEDCVACQYVWKQVEMDVGNSAITQTIYDSFHANAVDAQRTPVFYPACQSMFDAADDMIGDYMDGYTVDQICENSMLCRMRDLRQFLKHQRITKGV
jgi:hypothetical protein